MRRAPSSQPASCMPRLSLHLGGRAAPATMGAQQLAHSGPRCHALPAVQRQAGGCLPVLPSGCLHHGGHPRPRGLPLAEPRRVQRGAGGAPWRPGVQRGSLLARLPRCGAAGPAPGRQVRDSSCQAVTLAYLLGRCLAGCRRGVRRLLPAFTRGFKGACSSGGTHACPGHRWRHRYARRRNPRPSACARRRCGCSEAGGGPSACAIKAAHGSRSPGAVDRTGGASGGAGPNSSGRCHSSGRRPAGARQGCSSQQPTEWQRR